MRIIGEVSHPKYKISVLKMNEKITVQIEERLVSQSYTFRDGSGIKDLESVEKLLNPEFMKNVEDRFHQMNVDYLNALEKMNEDEFEDFDII